LPPFLHLHPIKRFAKPSAMRIFRTNQKQNTMKRVLGTLMLSAALIAGASAQSFNKKEFVAAKGDTLKYQVLLPEGYDQGKKYPLVIFLHGSGERAMDNNLQLKHGSAMFTNPVNLEKYPSIVLFPQCPTNGNWIKTFPSRNDRGEMDWNKSTNDSISQPLQAVKELIQSYIANEKVDTKRVYIVGLSMGGMGTFDLVARNPELFAAAIPICGGVYPPRLSNAAKSVAFRIYHGDADQVVACKGSRDAYTALKKFGAKVEYVEFPGIEHNSWTPAFNQPDFMEWLYKQKKKK